LGAAESKIERLGELIVFSSVGQPAEVPDSVSIIGGASGGEPQPMRALLPSRPGTIGTMLEGRRISLRPVREADLDRLYDAHTAIRARGAYYPLGIMSEPAFRRSSRRTGSVRRPRACC